METKKIFVLGNGFDLAHYLPTAYIHFMEAMQVVENSHTSSELGFDDLFKSRLDNEDWFLFRTKELYKTDDLILTAEIVDDLREKFELQNKYKLFNNLKIRVIEPSIKEINEHTDLSVSYTQITKGRKVIALRFSITNKNKIKKQKNEKEEVSKAKIKPLEVLKIITTNDLLNRFLQHGESTEDLINRIKSDFKNDQSKWWINKLLEFDIAL